MRTAVQLAFGTLSILPLGHPAGVDRRTWGRALLLAPVVGVVLGTAAWAVAYGVADLADAPMLGAVAGVSALALLTRGLHLDGLADVADGLGSRRPPAEARAIMKRSDIGPFGVIAIVLFVLLQVAALEPVLAASTTASAVTVIGAAMISRAAIVCSCRRGVGAAASDGFGGQVAGTVPRIAALTFLTASVAAVSWAAWISGADSALPVAASAVVAFGAAELWRRHCSHRFGGITGDVLGSVEQLTFTTFLVSVALLLP